MLCWAGKKSVSLPLSIDRSIVRRSSHFACAINQTKVYIYSSMISSQAVIVIPGIEWDLLRRTHQEVSLPPTGSGSHVLYIENAGVRWPTPRNARHVVRRLERRTRSLSATSSSATDDGPTQ